MKYAIGKCRFCNGPVFDVCPICEENEIVSQEKRNAELLAAIFGPAKRNRVQLEDRVRRNIKDDLKNREDMMNSEELFFNSEEAAKYLRIARATLYQLTHKRKIKFYQPGGKLIYFKKKDLDDWVFSSESTRNIKQIF